MKKAFFHDISVFVFALYFGLVNAIVNRFTAGILTITVIIISLLVVFSFAAKAQVYTAGQSSTYSTCTGTYANLTDGNFNTGPGTNNGTEWIKATFAVPQTVTAVSVAGGNINVTCSWGGVATYLNTAVIQSSTDDAVWTTRATVSGVTDGNGINTFSVGCVTAQYWRIQKSGYLATTEFTFTFASTMSYSSSTTNQNNTTSVSPGITNNEVIGIQIVTTGCSSPLDATGFSLNTTGTTNAANDISNAKLWYTGTSSAFATTSQFGSTVAAPNGSFSFTGTQTLAGGTNYFWLTYDVTAGATVNNYIDGECTSLTVGSAYTPTVTAPAGSRIIAACANTYTASQSTTYSTCTGTYANLTDGNFNTGPGTNSSATEWIKATFACPKTVTAVSVAGGNINVTCSWGGVATYLNTAVIQSSTDDAVWTDRATISGVTDANGLNTFSVGCVTAQYWRIKRTTANYLATAEFSFTFSSPMAYSSSTTTQNNTSVVGKNTTNNDVIGIQIVTTGCSSPLDATSFSLNTTGTTAPATDITNAKLWYTGTSSAYATTTQFGSTVAAPNGAFTITGSQTLSQGTNYFWLSYDIPSGATANNYIDGECTSLTVGTPQTPTVTAPAGNRKISPIAPPTFQCSSTNWGDCTSGSTFVIAKPACVTTNDLMIAHFTYRTATSDVGITPPAGWTQIFYLEDSKSGGSNPPMTAFYKIATASEPATYTFSGVVNLASQSMAILVYRGVDVTNPIEFIDVKPTYSASIQTPLINSTTDMSMIVALFGIVGCSTCPTTSDCTVGSGGGGTTNAFTPPAGMTERYDWGGTGLGARSQAGYDMVQASAGCVQQTATLTGGLQWGAAAIMGLRPAGVANSLSTLYLSGSSVYNSGLSVTVSKPLNVIQNDLMVVHLVNGNNNADNASAPAGWTKIRYETDGASNVSSWIYYKVAGASEPGTYAFSTATGYDLIGDIRAYRGIDPTTPLEASAGAITSGTSHSTPSITTTTDSALIVTFYNMRGQGTYTEPSGTVERYDYAPSASNYYKTSSGDDYLLTPAGSSGTVTATSSVSGIGIAQIAAFNRLSGKVSPNPCGFSIVLPVEWLSFTAKLMEEKKVKLNWETASEINNDYFSVERSIDGESFEKIGTVQGAGNSSTIKNYSFIDNRIETLSLEPEIVLYYRIRQTDYDGQYEYSEIRAVTLKDKKRIDVNIHPNPANERAYTDIFISEEKNLLLEIYNSLGEKIFTKNYFLSAGVHSILIDFTWFTDGIYLIAFHTADEIVYKKIVLQKNILR